MRPEAALNPYFEAVAQGLVFYSARTYHIFVMFSCPVHFVIGMTTPHKNLNLTTCQHELALYNRREYHSSVIFSCLAHLVIGMMSPHKRLHLTTC